MCDGALRRTVIEAIDYEAVCRSGGDYRHASIAPGRGASASVIQVCIQVVGKCRLRNNDDDDDGLLTYMTAFVIHSARAHGVHWPDCANSRKMDIVG